MNGGLLSISEFVRLLAARTLELDAADELALEKIAKNIEKEAKSAIGTYKFGWPQLAPSTQAERVHQGFSANEPLLRTGELRDSIEHQATHKEAVVGSNSDIAVYQELGTSRIPPRSFLKESLVRKIPESLDIIGREVVGTLSGSKVP